MKARSGGASPAPNGHAVPISVAGSNREPGSEVCSGSYRFGPWWVDPPTGMLRHGAGEERRLRPQEMDLLCLLAAADGRVVSRDEILAAVWEGAEVEEGAISRCVSLIRKALGDQARAPRYIETIPKRGYRLIAPVEQEPVERESAEREPVVREPGGRRPGGPGRLLGAAAAAAAAVLAAVALGSNPAVPGPTAQERPVMAALELSRGSTEEVEPGPAERHLEDARKALRAVDYPRIRAAAARAALAAQVAEEPTIEAEALLLKAGALEALGEVSQADEAMSQARRLLEAAGDRCGLARASLTFRDTADPRRIPVPLDELPEVFGECGEPVHGAIALARLAKSWTGERVAEGEPLLDRALALAEQTGAPRALAEVWNVIGAQRYGYEDLAGSEAAFARAVEHARRAEDPYLVAGMLTNRAWLLRWLGRHAEESEVLQEAAGLARRIGNRYLLARILLTEARSDLRREDLEGAGAKTAEADRLALELGDPVLTSLALKMRTALHESRGEWGLAVAAQRRLVGLGRADRGSLEWDRRRLRLANALLEAGDDREAGAIVDDVAARYPVDETADSTAIYARFQAAQIDLRRGDPQRAAERFLVILPSLVTKEEVGLRRDAARFAVAVDLRLAEPRIQHAWARLADAPRGAVNTPDGVDQALRLLVDRGRLLWFAGDRAGARRQIEQAGLRARSEGRTGLAEQISGEIEGLQGYRRYWSWRFG